jgi:hypothetical protein
MDKQEVVAQLQAKLTEDLNEDEFNEVLRRIQAIESGN